MSGLKYIKSRIRVIYCNEASVGSIIFVLLVVFFLSSGAFAGENLFNSTTAIKNEIHTIGKEYLDVVYAPVDTEHHGLVGTAIVAGLTGFAYVFDDNIRDHFKSNTSDTFDNTANLGNFIGNPLVHIGVAGVIYGGSILSGSEEWQETGQMLGEAAFLADGTSFVLKEVIGRERPFTGDGKGRFRPFQFDSDYDSMPSMHTASAFAMASVMAARSESLLTKTLYYTAAGFVGFSRVYKDRHWASDVILGAAIGELCGRVVIRYHSSVKPGVILFPAVSGDSASLTLRASW